MLWRNEILPTWTWWWNCNLPGSRTCLSTVFVFRILANVSPTLFVKILLNVMYVHVLQTLHVSRKFYLICVLFQVLSMRGINKTFGKLKPRHSIHFIYNVRLSRFHICTFSGFLYSRKKCNCFWCKSYHKSIQFDDTYRLSRSLYYICYLYT